MLGSDIVCNQNICTFSDGPNDRKKEKRPGSAVRAELFRVHYTIVYFERLVRDIGNNLANVHRCVTFMRPQCLAWFHINTNHNINGVCASVSFVSDDVIHDGWLSSVFRFRNVLDYFDCAISMFMMLLVVKNRDILNIIWVNWLWSTTYKCSSQKYLMWEQGTVWSRPYSKIRPKPC